MAVFETWLRNDLKKPVKVKQLEGNLFSTDNGGNLIGVEVMNNGQAASLSGGVTGYIIRADGQTVIINGSLSGNRASITLPASAYVVVGQISIVIKVGTTTVGACTGYVYRTSTDAIVDPGHVIPSLEELLAQIANCIAATSAANTAAGAANTAAGSANTAAGAANTAAGTANTAAGAANTAASGATSAAGSANSAAAAATTAAGAANTAAGKIDNMTVAAQEGAEPGATISEVDGHKHILFTLKRGEKGDKGDKGDSGKDFEIRKTFASIAAMQAYDPDTDPSAKKVRENDFVMIDTGSVQDVDTGKLYCYEPTTQDVWRYIGDLSGSQGIKGETGTGIANIVLNQDYTLTITMDDGHTSYTTASIRGAQGQQGIAGVSPTVTVTTITGGHQVSITDATGTNTFDVMDGADGQDGADGADGQDGTNAYVHIRYSHNQPTQDSDMGTTADDWIGIYSGSSSTAPTTYTSYTWYKIKGETGSAANVYGSTVPMSPTDSTKLKDAIDGKADQDTNAVTGNFAAFDANGNPVDSGHKHSDYLTQHQDISGKADKDTNAVTGNFAAFDANGNPVDSGHKHGDYLTQHQDISGKADKVQNATANNLAGLDANGNLKDSGKAASDFALSTELASVENGLAYRETGTTASRNISNGEYVFWNGAMYKANGNIASGTTLVSGTNLTPTENALNALNSNIQTSQWQVLDTAYATIRIRKAGNVAMLWIYTDKEIPANTEIGEVPASYRFSFLPYPSMVTIRDGMSDKKLQINSDGKIKCVDGNPIAGIWIVATVTWVIG